MLQHRLIPFVRYHVSILVSTRGAYRDVKTPDGLTETYMYGSTKTVLGSYTRQIGAAIISWFDFQPRLCPFCCYNPSTMTKHPTTTTKAHPGVSELDLGFAVADRYVPPTTKPKVPANQHGDLCIVRGILPGSGLNSYSKYSRLQARTVTRDMQGAVK